MNQSHSGHSSTRRPASVIALAAVSASAASARHRSASSSSATMPFGGGVCAGLDLVGGRPLDGGTRRELKIRHARHAHARIAGRGGGGGRGGGQAWPDAVRGQDQRQHHQSRQNDGGPLPLRKLPRMGPKFEPWSLVRASLSLSSSSSCISPALVRQPGRGKTIGNTEEPRPRCPLAARVRDRAAARILAATARPVEVGAPACRIWGRGA